MRVVNGGIVKIMFSVTIVGGGGSGQYTQITIYLYIGQQLAYRGIGIYTHRLAEIYKLLTHS